MKEVKNNKKPFIFYYTIVIVIMILLNMFVFPRVLSPTVKEVGYDTFLTMLDKKEIQQVQVEDNQIKMCIRDSHGAAGAAGEAGHSGRDRIYRGLLLEL